MPKRYRWKGKDADGKADSVGPNQTSLQEQSSLGRHCCSAFSVPVFRIFKVSNVVNRESGLPQSGKNIWKMPGRVAQSVGHLTRKSGVLGSIPGRATYFRFSFRFFKKGSCQLLAKVCARSTG